MRELRRIRVENGPFDGRIDLGEAGAWIIEAYEDDPDAIWEFRYDEGSDPEGFPQTQIAVLRKVES